MKTAASHPEAVAPDVDLAVIPVLTATPLDDDWPDGGGAGTSFPCATGFSSAECPAYVSLADLDPGQYAADVEECGCILVSMCRLTGVFLDFETVVDPDGNEVTRTTYTECRYGGCGGKMEVE